MGKLCAPKKHLRVKGRTFHGVICGLTIWEIHSGLDMSMHFVCISEVYTWDY